MTTSTEVVLSPLPENAWKKHGRTLLFGIGIVAIAAVIRSVGPGAAARTLVSAGLFLPIILVLEAAWMGMDIFVLRALLGDVAKKAPWRAYLHSGVTAYSVNILFPAGRASAEVARAAMLSRYFGGGRAALAGLEMQGASLIGNALIMLTALLVTIHRLGTAHRLVWVIGGSMLMTSTLGTVLLFGARTPRLWAFLKKRIPRLADASLGRESSSSLGQAILFSFVGRLFQCSLFVVVVFAITGFFSLASGSIAQSIAIAGATVGDAVPQQAGVLESSFFYFAAALDLADAPAKAVSIALLVRVCQLSLAITCATLGFVWKRKSLARSA